MGGDCWRGGSCCYSTYGSGNCGKTEAENEEQGLPSPPLDEGALLPASTTSLEMSQLFNFMDDIRFGDGNGMEGNCLRSIDLFTKDSLYTTSEPQLRGMSSDHNKRDTESSMHCNYFGTRVLEERGNNNSVDRLERKLKSVSINSATHNLINQKELGQHGGLSTSKSGIGSSGPGRLENDASKLRIGAGTGNLGPGGWPEVTILKGHLR